MTEAVFAIPGDHRQRTGGYIYEASVLSALNEIGCQTELLPLPASFPDPIQADMAYTIAALAAVSDQHTIILDGFLVGSLDPRRLDEVRAPMIGIVHHPLGHETGLAPERARFLQANEKAVLAHLRHVIVPSPHTAQVLVDDFAVGPDRISIALPGFLRPKIAPCPATPPVILSVGLLAPRKGHDVLLDALGKLKNLDWRAEIVGKAHDIGYSARLHDQCRALGLTNRICFTGELEPPALQTRFAAASVFALATRYEGYGMVLSEAMLHHLPVVSCKVGAVPDTVGKAGLLVECDNAAAFADALRDVLTNNNLRRDLADKATERAKALPHWQDTAEIFARIVYSLR
ncbi:MAG: glycosyltransferase family 4 protein [Pseudomonadota bacterium]